MVSFRVQSEKFTPGRKIYTRVTDNYEVWKVPVRFPVEENPGGADRAPKGLHQKGAKGLPHQGGITSITNVAKCQISMLNKCILGL